MPLLLSTNELRANMRLVRPVTQGQHILLPAGKVLNSADVDALLKACPDTMVYIADPMLDEAVPFADDSHDRDVARAAKKQLLRTLAGVRQRFAPQMSLKNMDFRGVHEAVSDVVQYIRDNPVVAAILSEHSGAEHYLTEHPANVFYLSLVLGNAVRGYVRKARAQLPASFGYDSSPPLDLKPLALAALLQDISLWPLEELYTTCAPLTDKQREFVRRHPIASVEMLPSDVPRPTRLAIQQHHESFDGSGYPAGLSGDGIQIFGRILRICDAFDAATATTVYSKAKSPARALGEMLHGSYSRLYDPLLLKVFSHLVQPFPIGAKLRLGCGRFGVVVRYGQTDPFRPVIVIAFERDGARMGPNDIEGPYALEDVPEITIQSFRDEDVSDLYQASELDDEPLILTDFADLFESSFP